MLLFALLSEKPVALLFQCQFIKVVFLRCTNRTGIVIFQKIVPNVNSANFWECTARSYKTLSSIRLTNATKSVFVLLNLYSFIDL